MGVTQLQERAECEAALAGRCGGARQCARGGGGMRARALDELQPTKITTKDHHKRSPRMQA